MAKTSTEKTAEWRKRNIDKYRAYRRNYEKKYRETTKRKKYMALYSKKWNIKNLEKLSLIYCF